jgi:hypothetical protein
MKIRTCFALTAALALAAAARADTALDSLKSDSPELKSATALTFGPEGILFVADPAGAAIYALDTGDRTPGKGDNRPKVTNLDEKIASLIGIDAKQLSVNNLAVNPISGTAYLSVSRGRGPDAKPVIVRVGRDSKVAEFNLKGVKYAKAELPNAATGQRRNDAITGMAFVKDRLFVAGLSNEEFASKFRSIPFPFQAADKGTSVEIYHGSHGRFETASPIRTFVPFDIGGETNLLAAYTCTPLVKVPVKELKPGEKIKGTTIAELGNRNNPLDMVVYEKGGKRYILIANSARGVMKVTTEGIDKAEGITAKVADKAGLQYETIANLKGVQRLAGYDKTHALVLQRDGNDLNLTPIELP